MRHVSRTQRKLSHVMSGTIFSICLTSAIFKLCLLLSEFHLCQLPKNDGEKNARRERRSEDCCKVMPTLNLASHAATSSSTVQSRKVRGYSGHSVNLIGRAQEDLQREKTQSRHSVEFSSATTDAMLDESTRRLVAAEVNQELLNFHGNLKSARKLVATGSPDIDGTDRIWPHNLHISTAYVPHIEKVFSNVRQRYGLSPGDKNGKSRCECGYMGNSYVRHSSSCS